MRPVLVHHAAPSTTMNAHPSEILPLADPRLIDIQYASVEPMVVHSVGPGALQQLAGHLRRLFGVDLTLDDGVVNVLTANDVHELVELPGTDPGPSQRRMRALGAIPRGWTTACAGRLFDVSCGCRRYLSGCLLQWVDGRV